MSLKYKLVCLDCDASCELIVEEIVPDLDFIDFLERHNGHRISIREVESDED